MNKKDITALLNNPENITVFQTNALEQVVLQYPYFQAARALYLKGLFNMESFRYNYELKKTAALTTDRTVLFDFLTSTQFKTIQHNSLENTIKIQEEIITVVKNENEKIVAPNFDLDIALETVFDESIFEEKQQIVVLGENENEEQVVFEKSIREGEKVTMNEEAEASKPFTFETNETHSFNEWLTMTHLEPIQRDTVEEENDEEVEINDLDAEKLKKENLIDKFIEANPKIPAIKQNVAAPANLLNKIEETSHLMTETLARIYLEQKKYLRAIQAYDILILKYPEKSSFFADQIKKIKELQYNNK